MKKNHLLFVGAAVPLFGLAILAALNPGSSAETSAGGEEDLRTRRYKIDLATFARETKRLVPNIKTYARHWKIVGANASMIKAEVPVVVFTDDLKIEFSCDAETGETIVDARSASRLGNSDLGENRRHIRRLLKVLDERFGAN